MKLLSSDFFPAKQAYRWRTTSLNDTADAEDFPEQVWMRTAGNDSSLLCTQVSQVSSCSCQQLFMMDQRNEQNLSLVFNSQAVYYPQWVQNAKGMGLFLTVSSCTEICKMLWPQGQLVPGTWQTKSSLAKRWAELARGKWYWADWWDRRRKSWNLT